MANIFVCLLDLNFKLSDLLDLNFKQSKLTRLKF
jgi:hypothetical protein